MEREWLNDMKTMAQWRQQRVKYWREKKNVAVSYDFLLDFIYVIVFISKYNYPITIANGFNI